MADNNVVHVGENSPEQVALKLLIGLAKHEGKDAGNFTVKADREWLTENYAHLLQVVKNPHLYAPDKAR